MDDYNPNTITSVYQNLRVEQENEKETNNEILHAFIKFVKEYRNGNIFKYREQLQESINKGTNYLTVDFEDLESENSNLADVLIHKPNLVIPLFEEAIFQIAQELGTEMQKDNEEKINQEENKKGNLSNSFQFILNSNGNPKSLRDINSSNINELVIVSGIIVSASKSGIKMKECAVQCRNCGHLKRIDVPQGFNSVKIPRQCDNTKLLNQQKEKCPLDSYMIIPEKSSFIDVQTLKIQETPEMIPVGEIPRNISLYCDRHLVDKVIPGNRVTVIGIQCLDNSQNINESANNKNDKSCYIKVINFKTNENKKKSNRSAYNFTQEEESKFKQLSKNPKIYELISESIAPAIFGSEDIKKAIACLLFGGCRKKLRGGVNLRGDINILLLGDPSTGKSQFLKFVERAAPVAVYTSGKGSSAAGLTASIIRDGSSGEFQLEGGAMVLADGGVVCIDEFDKMRSQDRVAIHEAMEQQTISVAKAGITTTLNSRTSVLAAANPIFGHIDDLKSTQEQIDFQTTILSRFDCIFLIKDVHNFQRDKELAEHIIDISATSTNVNKSRINENKKSLSSDIDVNLLRKYIAYAKLNCSPKLSDEAATALQNFYVSDRKNYSENKTSKKGNDIPVTVRQLEAIIRMSEAIAKMGLNQNVSKKHVEEAHRLFQISTLYAANSHSFESFSLTPENQKDVVKIEDAIKRRLSIGQRIQYNKLIDELNSRFTTKKLIDYALINLIKIDVLKFNDEKKIIIRKK